MTTRKSNLDRMRVLVVEDDPATASLREQAIREEGYTAFVESDGVAALDTARSRDFDAIVLDVMLPGIDGFTVAQRLRGAGCQTPILMLTARDAERDVIHGLNIGADDYLIKPFALDVFFARLRAVARRGPIPGAVVLSAADLTVDTAGRQVRRGARTVELTRTEYNLLELLLRNAGRVLSREAIIESVWGYGAVIEGNTLDAFVHSLRSKVDADGEPKLIQTIRGVGYTVREK
jgi:DNA-binding response OmpR family regulator